ncbi:hypothetical protein AWC12_20520 [Mycolicibacterium iranicum]|uniref:Integrase n=1 Tax=Mycolicibacterium iranicum TaxID=912594 RepID=A0A1X1WFV1_MYCIR|nr:hypothetical protein AWC12_20520 [Mycolicibacterium iranicum]
MSMFEDDSWSLRPMSPNSGRAQNLHWISEHARKRYEFPPQLVKPFKRIIWLAINRPAPASYLAGTSGATWAAASTIETRFKALRRFAKFLGQHDITELCEIDYDLLDTYVTDLRGEELSSDPAGDNLLGVIAGIAHLAPDLPETDRMVEPSWVGGSVEKGDRTRGADNSKAIIHPDTFAPLLWWCQRIVQCAPDIIAAVEWLKAVQTRQQPPEASRTGLDAVGKLVELRKGVLPQGKDGYVAAQYLVALHGGDIHEADFGHWRQIRGGTYALAESSLPQPIPVPVNCTIEGKPWVPAIDFRDVRLGKLLRVLQAAAAVLICTCTGMRGEECRRLQRGALRIVPRPDGAYSYRIDGRIFKAVRDENDQQRVEGKPWVWATIKPGADAIASLERLAEVTNSRRLLAHPRMRALGVGPPRAGNEESNAPPMSAQEMTRWISELVDFANNLAGVLGLDDAHHIAADPAGRVTLDRFRRSVAWHIVNQPEGLVAAGVQFGHMKSTTTDGYGSTMTSGIAATMDKERTHALYNTLQDHANAAKTGLKVSGPAAKRLGNALNRFTVNQFPGTYADLSKKEERRLRSDPDMAVRDNPGHACLCLADPMKPETMACTRENDGEPNRNDCKTYCGSRVYTDATIAQDKKEAAQLRDRLQNVNPILAARIARRITHLEEHIAKHENTALPLLTIVSAEEAKAACVVEKDQPLSSKPPNVPTDGDVA